MKWKSFWNKKYGHTQSSGVSKGLSRSSRCVNPFETRLRLAVFEQPHDCNFRLSLSQDVFWTPSERIIAKSLVDGRFVSKSLSAVSEAPH
jgi:hypothetical protein